MLLLSLKIPIMQLGNEDAVSELKDELFLAILLLWTLLVKAQQQRERH